MDSTALLTATVAQQTPVPSAPGVGEEFEASPIALVVILVIGIITVFLIRGMAKRIRRLPASFDAADAADDAEEKRD